jgi:hypothetical protein
VSSAATRLLAKERAHHARAFEHYYGLGEQRSYDRVAAEFSVAASTVKLWARSFGWQDRVKERDLVVARESGASRSFTLPWFSSPRRSRKAMCACRCRIWTNSSDWKHS